MKENKLVDIIIEMEKRLTILEQRMNQVFEDEVEDNVTRVYRTRYDCRSVQRGAA